MPLSQFDICSNALLRIGADTITDFSGASAESFAAGKFYQPTADNWLSLYDWNFAKQTALLVRDVTAPLQSWDASYAQPTGAIKIRSVKVNDVSIEFDRAREKILCNAKSTDSVYCEYTNSVDCAYWPPYFVELMELALALKFSFTLAGKIDLKNVIEADLQLQFRLAKNADARQQTTRRIRLDGKGTILEARRA